MLIQQGANTNKYYNRKTLLNYLLESEIISWKIVLILLKVVARISETEKNLIRTKINSVVNTKIEKEIMNIINPPELNITSTVIGKGTFGIVREAYLKGTKVAAKEMYSNVQSDFINELNILTRLDHKNCVKLYSYNIEFRSLIMEYCPYNLYTIIHQQGTLSVEIKKKLFIDILEGVMYLHKSEIIHRDLKPSNILITSDNVAKITDYGTSKIVENAENNTFSTVKFCGTPGYWAPEFFYSMEYGRETDAYSLGIILWELWEQKTIYEDIPELRSPYPNEWIKAQRHIHDNSLRPKLFEFTLIHPSLCQLIQQLWSVDKAGRPDLDYAKGIIEKL